jgi:thioredoxin reductase (NADPH)
MTTTEPARRPETPDVNGAFPRLSAPQLQTLAAHGRRRPVRPVDVRYREGRGLRLLRGPREQDGDTRRPRRRRPRGRGPRLPHRWIDLERDKEAEALLSQLSIAPEETPVVIWRGQQVLRNPTNAELARAIGLPAPGPGMDRFDLVIVGAGPAGPAAAVYGASEG